MALHRRFDAFPPAPDAHSDPLVELRPWEAIDRLTIDTQNVVGPTEIRGTE